MAAESWDASVACRHLALLDRLPASQVTNLRGTGCGDPPPDPGRPWGYKVYDEPRRAPSALPNVSTLAYLEEGGPTLTLIPGLE